MSVENRRFGLAHSHKLRALADRLARQTNFNADECKTLLIFHIRLEMLAPLDRKRFGLILVILFDICNEVMLDLVFHAFDRDNDGFVDDIEWVRGLSVMLRGSLEQLTEFTYYVYDINGDRSLARDELATCLKGCLFEDTGIEKDEMEESERDIVDIAMKKLDMDNDGQITYEDFINCVKADPLLLQACGTCLPSSDCAGTFLGLVTEKYRSYTCAFPQLPKKFKQKSKKRFGYLKAVKESKANIFNSDEKKTSQIQQDGSFLTKSLSQPLDQKVDHRTQSMSLSIVKTARFQSIMAFKNAAM